MNEILMFASTTVLALLFSIKVIILFRAARRKTLRRWFYFTQQEIIEAPTPQAARLRKTQNSLSIVFFVLASFAAFLVY